MNTDNNNIVVAMYLYQLSMHALQMQCSLPTITGAYMCVVYANHHGDNILNDTLTEWM